MLRKIISIAWCMVLIIGVEAYSENSHQTPQTSSVSRVVKPARDEKTTKKDKKNKKPETPQPEPYTVTPLSKGQLKSILDNRWYVQQVGDVKLKREDDNPYIIFQPADETRLGKKINKFYVSTGCNYINGEYSIEEPNKITFRNVVATENYCTERPEDTDIKIMLGVVPGSKTYSDKTVTVKTVSKNGEESIVLTDKNGHEMLVHKPTVEALDGNWQIAQVNDTKIDDETLTIFFDMKEKRVHGNTGCNSFNGDIYVDPTTDKVISLSKMGVTMRMCPNLDLQRKILIALEEASIVNFENKNSVILKNSDGVPVLRLERLKVER